MTLDDKARTFLALHRPGEPLVAPSVWDPWSAEVAAGEGFAALTVGSSPAAAALGRDDGEQVTLDEMLAQVARIAAAVDIPVSADLESGYGASPDRIIDGLLEAGAIGLNIEDTVHSEGGRLREVAEHADLVGALRAAADAAGVHVVVNARTDVILDEIGPPETRIDVAIERLRAAAAAGADVLYPIGFPTDDERRRLSADLPLPVNVLGRLGIDTLAGLAATGVGRVSFGPYLQDALASAAKDALATWR
ncbi:MAG TPA: isocitrate lyase/phosphoenolpyruvate mutase family protein [Nocardioidaceae bacterium]|nr:isocitrate lyase/phosphoenolpyruvate mutase family protein [Nocardioidaceae bacterium]